MSSLHLEPSTLQFIWKSLWNLSVFQLLVQGLQKIWKVCCCWFRTTSQMESFRKTFVEKATPDHHRPSPSFYLPPPLKCMPKLVLPTSRVNSQKSEAGCSPSSPIRSKLLPFIQGGLYTTTSYLNRDVKHVELIQDFVPFTFVLCGTVKETRWIISGWGDFRVIIDAHL